MHVLDVLAKIEPYHYNRCVAVLVQVDIIDSPLRLAIHVRTAHTRNVVSLPNHTHTHTPIIFAPIKCEPCDYRLREKRNQNSTGDIALSTDATENGVDSVHGRANPQDKPIEIRSGK